MIEPSIHYKYIHFVMVEKLAKTQVWDVRNTRSSLSLGKIRWFGPWRQYCFYPTDAIFNTECLENIQEFMRKLNSKHKKDRADGK